MKTQELAAVKEVIVKLIVQCSDYSLLDLIYRILIKSI